MTKVEAIIEVLRNNGGIATWEIIYNEIENYYPNAKQSRDWRAGIRGVVYREIKNNKSFKNIDEGTFSLLDFDENSLVPDDIKDEGKNTSKDILTTIRVGQSQFRQELIKSLRRCPITKIDEPEILNASHIKPWVMSNDQERLDIKNGLLLAPTFDKLFDRGFITFTNDRQVLISESLNQENIKRIGISRYQKFDELPILGREEYLEYHRKKIFRN